MRASLLISDTVASVSASRPDELPAAPVRRATLAARLRDAAPLAGPLLADELLPALRLATRAVPDPEIPLTASKLGGNPDLPASLPWPTFEGAPMRFLLQLNLDALPDGGLHPGIPRAGMLSFFITDHPLTPEAHVVHTTSVLTRRRGHPDPLPAAIVHPFELWTWPLAPTLLPAEDAELALLRAWYEEQICSSLPPGWAAAPACQLLGHHRCAPTAPAWQPLLQMESHPILGLDWPAPVLCCELPAAALASSRFTPTRCSFQP